MGEDHLEIERGVEEHTLSKSQWYARRDKGRRLQIAGLLHERAKEIAGAPTVADVASHLDLMIANALLIDTDYNVSRNDVAANLVRLLVSMRTLDSRRQVMVDGELRTSDVDLFPRASREAGLPSTFGMALPQSVRDSLRKFAA
jgi:hypothetical protein